MHYDFFISYVRGGKNFSPEALKQLSEREGRGRSAEPGAASIYSLQIRPIGESGEPRWVKKLGGPGDEETLIEVEAATHRRCVGKLLQLPPHRPHIQHGIGILSRGI